MPHSVRIGLRIALLGMILACFPFSSRAQNPPAANKPQPVQSKKPAVGPAAPQSRHYPILLIAQGNEPFWNLRLGI